MATKRSTTVSGSRKEETEQARLEEMSAIDLLEEDHRQVEGFFDEYEELEDASDKNQLALKICTVLQLHTQLEEEIFYPAAREAIEEPKLIDEAIVEHASAKQLIGEIENMKPGDELYDAKLKVLQEQVLHHVEEEEGELFPQVEASELDLDALGKKMAERKATLLSKSSVEAHPDKPRVARTNGRPGDAWPLRFLVFSANSSTESRSVLLSSTLCAITGHSVHPTAWPENRIPLNSGINS